MHRSPRRATRASVGLVLAAATVMLFTSAQTAQAAVPVWTTQALPAGTPGLGPVSCVSTSNCMAAGLGAGAVVVTADGGATWTTQSHPAGMSHIFGLACVDVGHCWAVGNDASNPGAALGAVAATADGGQTWSTQTIPGTTNLLAVACTDATHCWAAGESHPTVLGAPQVAAVVETADGSTWSAQTLPASLVTLDSISCPTSTMCMAGGLQQTASGIAGEVITTTDAGNTWTASRIDSGVHSFLGISCATALRCWATGAISSSTVGVIYATTDGGASWVSQTPPAGIRTIASPACADSLHCWAVGTTFNAQFNRFSTALITTIDGGQTWTNNLATDNLGSVDCVTIQQCWAVGGGQFGFVLHTANGAPPPALLVTVGGTGVGTVTGSSVGISCPGACSADPPIGTTVTLHAAGAEDATSFFRGWGDQCVSQPSPADCTVLISAAQTTVFADFETVSAVVKANIDKSFSSPTTERVAFNGCESTVDENQVFVYDWTVGDRPTVSTVVCNGFEPLGYSLDLPPGDYPVTLTVRTVDGSKTSTTSNTVQIRPFVTFSWQDQTVSSVGDTTVPVVFNACASGGISTFTWQTPVGTATTDCNVSITLPVGTAEQITLTGTDPTGNFEAVVSQQIDVVASTGAPPGSCDTWSLGADACWRQSLAGFGDVLSGATRNPDYVVLQGGADETIALAMTCDGNTYTGTAVGIGILSLPINATVAIGYVGDTHGPAPPPAQIDSFVEHLDYALSGGLFQGVNFTASDNPDGPRTGTEYWKGLQTGLSFSKSLPFATEGTDNQPPAPGTACNTGVSGSQIWQLINDIPVTPNVGAPVADLTNGTTPIVLGSSVYVTATGFAPGTDILITVASTPDRLALVPADHTGTIGTTIILPADLPDGTHTLTATGIGADLQPLTESTTFQLGSSTATTTTVTSSVASPVVGQPVTFTAHVSPTAGTGDPTGTLSFTDNGVPIAGCQGLAVSSGSATCSQTYGHVGSHPISAAFTGSGAFLDSSGDLPVSVARAATSTGLTGSGLTFGQSTAFTASVVTTAPGGGTPGGSVGFTIDGVAKGSAPLSALGSATTAPVHLGSGQHVVVASYGGSADYLPSAKTVTFTVTCPVTITGVQRGSLTITRPTCLRDLRTDGGITVAAGASLDARNITLGGGLTSTGARDVLVCGSTINGSVTIRQVSGLLAFPYGRDPGTASCSPNRVTGRVTLSTT